MLKSYPSLRKCFDSKFPLLRPPPRRAASRGGGKRWGFQDLVVKVGFSVLSPLVVAFAALGSLRLILYNPRIRSALR